MKRKIALFGYYRFAVEISNFLDPRDYEVLVMDSNERNLGEAAARGLKTAWVDYRVDEELQKAGIGRDVDTLFSLFPDDAENVFMVISARALAPDIKIVTVAETPDAIPKLEAAGADKIIDPYEISARKIWQILKNPQIADILEHVLFGRTDLHLAQVEIPRSSFLDRRHIREVDLGEQYNLVVLGVVDLEIGDDVIFSTKGFNHKLDTGDILVVVGPGAGIRKLRRDLAGAAPER